jgi:glycosyltransferase involved in cell wall biosynthesis
MKINLLTPEFSAYGGGIATFYQGLFSALSPLCCGVEGLEGSGFAAFGDGELFTTGPWLRLSTKSVARWSLRFHHLEATPTLRKLLSAAWAAWEAVGQSGPYDVIEVSEFALLHVPHILEPLAPTVVQCHASWGQIGVRERSQGLELDQLLSLALETESFKHVAGRHTYSNMNAAYWREQTGLPFRMIRPCWRPITAGTKVEPDCPEVDGIIRVFGRIQAWKGPHVVAAAWDAAADLPDIDWHGRDVPTNSRGGSTNVELRMEHPLTWGVRIRPRPLVAPGQVARLQSRSLLNLVPSTWDVFNFTAAEAMASGRPVVCSDKAGASELIEDGRTGFVYDGNSSNALADTVRRAISLGSERLARIGAEGRMCIVEALRPEMQVRSHLEGYAAAIRAHSTDLTAVPDWFKAIAMPCDPISRRASHLDQYPLRDISCHVLDRTFRKFNLKS